MKMTKKHESIVNMMQSIMNYFDLTPYHHTMEDLDTLLKTKRYEHIVLLIQDGLGYMNLLEHLDESSFMRRHLKKSLKTVFPPTTTAATTSLLSGRYPCEHGWLGWNVYIDELDDTMTLFRNKSKYNHKRQFDFSIGDTYLPYERIVDRINKETHHRAYTVSPYGDTPYVSGNLEALVQTVVSLCKNEEKSYIYAYYEEPDALMHHYGTQSHVVHHNILELDASLEFLCSKLEKTLVLVCADHGHIDVENLFIEDYPQLQQMLLKETSIEPRACNFYIKEAYLDTFPDLFNELFGEHFYLYSKEEVYEKRLFGPCDPKFQIKGVGDYLAVALTHYTLNDSRNNYTFKSHHAGATQKEMLVPLMVIDCYE